MYIKFKPDTALVKVKEAAEMLGCDAAGLRIWIRSGTCPFGSYAEREGATKGKYWISRQKLMEYMGYEKGQ